MIIIKYKEWLVVNPDYRETIYELCNDDSEKIRQISKEEAVELIKKNNLKKVHQNEHGIIWK